MRILLLAAALAVSLTAIDLALRATPAAAQQSCTGENCPPPQSQGGHECESKKKEDTIS